jgi:hypothetical protein
MKLKFKALELNGKTLIVHVFSEGGEWSSYSTDAGVEVTPELRTAARRAARAQYAALVERCGITHALQGAAWAYMQVVSTPSAGEVTSKSYFDSICRIVGVK